MPGMGMVAWVWSHEYGNHGYGRMSMVAMGVVA